MAETDYYKVGPGTLQFGETGTEQEFSAQISECAVEPDSDSDDPLELLNGSQLEGETTFTASLTGTTVQDLKASGMVDWSWTNKGIKVPFAYTPSTERGATVTGQVVVMPLKVGGEAKTRPTSEFEFNCVGFPEFTPAADPEGFTALVSDTGDLA